MIQNRLKWVAVALVLLCMKSPSALAGDVYKIHELTKTGPVLLVVDDESVRKAAGAKPILWIDDKKILTEKDGPLLFFMPGDILMDKMDGNVCGYVDGRNILNKPSGSHLVYIDGPNIKEPDIHGKMIYYIEGGVMNNQQLMSVLYILRPDLIERAGPMPSGGAVVATPATPVAPSVAAKAGDAGAGSAVEFVGGSYTIHLYSSTDGTTHKGKVVFTKKGNLFAMDLQFTDATPWQGVAVTQNGELWAAVGPVNTVGLAIYKISGGDLTGTWMNAGGDPKTFGSEALHGAAGLSGPYTITSAKTPFTGAPYAGTVTIDPLDIRIGKGEQPFVQLTWDFSTMKIEGAGFKSGESLIAASSSAKDCAAIRFKINPKTGTLTGDSATSTKAHGS